MLVVMQHGATQAEVDRVVRTIEEMGYQARAMPGAQRTAVGLVYFKGMKYREAADELDVPVGTVKSRIHSAVKRLTEAWEQTQAGGASATE